MTCIAANYQEHLLQIACEFIKREITLMIFNLRPTIFHRQDNSTNMRRLHIQFIAYMLLFILLLSGASARAGSKKS